MPTYNVAAFVEEAVASVAGQTLADLDLVAVDDGSTDMTPGLLEGLVVRLEARGMGMRVFVQPNAGAAAARNAALRHARGRYVAFLDADDRLEPGALSALVAALENDATLDLAFPLIDYIDETGARIGVTSRPPRARFDFADLLVRNPIHSATGVVVRREAIEAVGGFDERLRAAIDLDCWVRIGMLRPANIGHVPAAVAHYRNRAGQITADWRRMRRGWLRVMRKVAAQRPDVIDALKRDALANRSTYWSTIAYAQGDYARSRGLMLAAWRASAQTLVRNRQAWRRSAACLVSLMPDPVHHAVRRSFDTLRLRLRVDLS